MTKTQLLSAISRKVAIGYSVLFFAAGLALGALGIRNGSVLPVALAIVMLCWAGGLAWRRPAAYRAAAGLTLLLVFFVPGALFSVFSVGDYLAAGKEPPDFQTTALWLLPLEVFMLCAVYFLDRKESDAQTLRQR